MKVFSAQAGSSAIFRLEVTFEEARALLDWLDVTNERIGEPDVFHVWKSPRRTDSVTIRRAVGELRRTLVRCEDAARQAEHALWQGVD